MSKHEAIPVNETAYERVQRFNALTRWLHSRRFSHMLDITTRLKREIPDRPLRIAEVGCAVGKLYGFLDERMKIDYVGLDHDPEFIRVANERYGTRDNFKVVCASGDDDGAFAELSRKWQPDLVCALETFEHIPEPISIGIIQKIAALRPRVFVASVPIEVGPSAWMKHLGSMLFGYARHKHRGAAEVFWAGLYQTHRLPGHMFGHSGWDYRWLSQSIRHFMDIKEVRKGPVPFLPSGLNFSIMFIAQPRPEAKPK